jgi:hypothetical protein
MLFTRRPATDEIWFVVETEHGRGLAVLSKLEIMRTPGWHEVIDIIDRAIARAVDSIRPLNVITDRDPGDEDEAAA